jgi:aldehyde:ferredoxin oxidoreductase
MREAFNIREGLTLPFRYPDRMKGVPPKTVGPRAGITLNEKDLFEEYFRAMSWDKNGKPSKARLEQLGLGFAAKELYK